MPRDRIRFVSMPLADVDHQVTGIGSTVQWDPVVGERLFQALRKDQPVEQAAAQAQAQAAASASASAPPAAADEPAAGAAPAGPMPVPVATPTPAKRRGHAKPQGPQPLAMSVHTAEQKICG